VNLQLTDTFCFMPDLDSSQAASSGVPHPNTAVALRQPYRLQTAVERQHEEQATDDSLTLTDLLRIVLKHKWTLLTVVLLACGAALIKSFLSVPLYRSTVILQIERAAPRVVSFNNDADMDQRGTDEATSLKTQIELLKSRSLAERVIDELRLDQSKSAVPVAGPDTAVPPVGEKVIEAGDEAQGDFLERIFSGYSKFLNPTTQNTEVLTRDKVVRTFLKLLTVEPVRNSRLIKLHVENNSPELAARIANTTVQAYIAMGLERRMQASSYAKTFLEDQIKQIKAKLEESERNLHRYAQDKQILTLDEKTSVINQTYTEYAAALARFEQDRIKAEALLAEMKRAPDSVAMVIENKTIQSYKEQRAKLQIEYQQNLRIYKPDFPKMMQIAAQIAEAESQIKIEIAAIAAGVQSQYDSAKKQEALVRDKLGETRQQVLSTQDSSIDLNLLKREVDTNRQLYDGLLQRLKQLGVSGDVVTNAISVVDAAEPSLFPHEPNLPRNLLIGLAAGLFLGLCIVFVLEFMDDSIKFPDEVERLLGLALMGIIPKVSNAKRADGKSVAMDVHDDPRSNIAEAYRSVRTALQFSTPEGAPKRLLVTSTERNEGKSTTAAALAINFAQMGHRVLLIDADMRNPSVHKLLGMSNDYGLSNLLSSEGRGEKLILPSAVKNLSVLTAGPVPPNPVDLLMGPKLLLLLNVTATLGIDYVIVDAPPLLGLADSIVLGNQLQNILFVVQASRTRKSHIKTALRRLRLAGVVPRGVVLTQMLRGSLPQDYESYYGYGPTQANVTTVKGALSRAG
jgi:polysaccharide biosynthesis transport protein